ncbi:MAG: LCP family protein [Anaerolineales bacterium]|nr:LCP family protein [Anaerolineales bacterium]
MTSHTESFAQPAWVRTAVKLLAFGLTLAFLAWSGRWLYQTVSSLAAQWEVTEPSFNVTVEQTQLITTDDPAAPPVIATAQPSAPLFTGKGLQPWEGTERVNILLLGIDERCDIEGPTRTDSMIVVTIDPVGQTAAALSLPRDLWVDIPGFHVDRINQAHYLGEVNEYPGGGPALAIDTVEAFLGIDIQYYGAINFDAFTEFIDLIGGIEIEVTESIDDPKYPDRCFGYDPFSIEVGSYVLDGETALKYARTRATAGGDVDRANRQQQVGLAIRDRILDAGQLPQLITQAPQLWQSFQRNVRTNMSPDEAIQLALLAQDIPAENIRTAVVDYNYVYLETTPEGQQVLVPLRDSIRELRNELFRPPAIPDQVIDNLSELMLSEGARIAVYNGTPTFGLAGATETYLSDLDFNIVGIGNAESSAVRATRIIDYGDHPYTTLYLSQLMSIPPLNISNGTDPEGDYDVLIILGNEWEVPQSSE